MRRRLHEKPLCVQVHTVPSPLSSFATEGFKRARDVDCFDYVPSDCGLLYATLKMLPRGRYCEWGSGIGLASSLGYEATGIEIHPELAEASRSLLTDFAVTATVTTGSYFDEPVQADVYFTYCWPGQMSRVEEHFPESAPNSSRLLICHGAEDIRCKTKLP